jgi:hypothetical protein
MHSAAGGALLKAGVPKRNGVAYDRVRSLPARDGAARVTRIILYRGLDSPGAMWAELEGYA